MSKIVLYWTLCTSSAASCNGNGSHLSTGAVVSLQVFDELWPGRVSHCDQRCAAICQTVTNRKWRRKMTRDDTTCGGADSSYTCVPGVGSQSLRCVWTQTGDGHDADAQVQALIGRPGLLSFCSSRSHKNKLYHKNREVCLYKNKCQSHLTLGPDPGLWEIRKSNCILTSYIDNFNSLLFGLYSSELIHINTS